MLAEAVDLDVLHDHHAVRLLREDRAVDDLLEIGARAGRQKGERIGDALRRLDETFPFRVLAQRNQYFANEVPNAMRIDVAMRRRHRTIRRRRAYVLRLDRNAGRQACSTRS